jgi:hypothetical protein
MAVVLIVGLAAGAYVAGRGSESGGVSSPNTTNAVTTTSVVATTTARAVTTTSAVITVGAGAVLAEPTGLSMYVAATSGEIYRIDLDSGSVTHYEISHEFDNTVGIVAVDDGAVVFDGYDYDADPGALYTQGRFGRGTTLYRLRADGSVDTIHVNVDAWRHLGDTSAGGVWLIGRNANGMPAALVDDTGASQVFISIPTGLTPIATDGGAVVAAGMSGTFRVDQGGPHRLTTGSLIGLSARYLVASTCDDRYRCTVTRTDRLSGEVDDLGPLPASLGASMGMPLAPGQVSPDGSSVALVQYETDGAKILHYDTRTGDVAVITTQVFGPELNAAWTSTGWFVRLGEGVVVLTRGDEQRTVELLGGQPSTSLAAIAIGPVPLT